MNFFYKLSNGIINGINNCMLGKIDNFNSKTMKADIMPLVKKRYENGEVENVSLLIEVPVSAMKAGPFVIRPPYRKGDIVLVVFADSDIENALLSGDVSKPNSTRKHSLDDAIVVGGVMPFTNTLPEEHSKDLIIGNEDFSTKIVLKEAGGILFESDKEITIKGPSGTESW